MGIRIFIRDIEFLFWFFFLSNLFFYRWLISLYFLILSYPNHSYMYPFFIIYFINTEDGVNITICHILK